MVRFGVCSLRYCPARPKVSQELDRDLLKDVRQSAATHLCPKDLSVWKWSKGLTRRGKGEAAVGVPCRLTRRWCSYLTHRTQAPRHQNTASCLPHT